MTIAQKQLQSARLIHIAFVIAAVIYAGIPFLINPANPRPVAPVIVFAFGLVALSTWAAGFFIRSRMVMPAAEALRNHPEDASAAARWRSGVVLSLTLCESVLLFGFALKMIGASWNVCVIFYVVGFFFLLAWTPRLELPAA